MLEKFGIKEDLNADGSRHKSRELALQMLFQCEFQPPPPQSDDFLSRFFANFQVDPSLIGYAQKIFKGVVKNQMEIDQKIEQASENWRLARMAAVDRGILRIATFEMLFSDASLPPEIVIDEAVEIAKKYGGSDTANFVNGVLDQVARTNRLK